MGNELMVQYEQGELTQWRDPEQVLAEATKAAEALIRVIALKKKPVMFNGEQYLELEDWQTVGKFYGLSPRIVETRYVEYGGVTGWEAVAEAVSQAGVVVSRAESMCMTDEDNWGMVPVYEWKDKLDEHGKKIWNAKLRDGKGGYEGSREKTSEKPKPMFQLRSMAQTRACAKALRQVLSWVVVLGGFKPNVAEEMIEAQLGPEQEQRQAKPPVTQPQRTSEKKAEKKEEVQSDPNVREISGSIQDVKAVQDGSLWLHIDNQLIYVKHDKVQAEMAAGNILSVKAGKLNAKSVGDYWATIEVLKCEAVQSGEEVVEDGSAEDDPTTKDYGFGSKDEPAAVKESPVLKDLVASGAVTTGSKLEQTAAKKEQSWKAHVGHDPAAHISYKQDGMIYRIQKANSLSDEVIKGIIDERFGVAHRYHILKEDYPELLDIIDQKFEFHEKK